MNDVPTIEKMMEINDIPESDREEVRMFQEFLQRRKDKRDGKTIPPLSDELRRWLTGEDAPLVTCPVCHVVLYDDAAKAGFCTDHELR